MTKGARLTAKPLPTFIILGAQKCGTTSLHAFLAQHPEICMSEPKETNFFNKHFDRGLEYYRETFFNKWEGHKAVGEASPAYLFLPYIPGRIAAALPRVKMVVILRDPARRAFSHWWMKTTFGDERLSFGEAVKRSLRLSSEDMAKAEMCDRFYLQAGYYAEQLQRYFLFFPREQFHILLSDDLKHDPEKSLREIHSFIGVTPQGLPQDTVNRFETLGPFAAKIRVLLRWFSMDNTISSRTGYAVRRLLMAVGDSPPKIDEKMRLRLVEHYRPYNRELQEILKVDLSKWGT